MHRRLVIISVLLHLIAFRGVFGVVKVANPSRVDSRAPVTDKSDDGPRAMGCYDSDENKPALNKDAFEDREDMSMGKCLQHCATNEHTLAGVQAGYKCYCSDELPNSPTQSPTFCMTTCTATNERCGGRNSISVYSFCPQERYGPSCELSCFCYQKGPCDIVTGICLNKQCQPLYKGERCDEEVTSLFTSIVNTGVKYAKTAWKFVKSIFVVDPQTIPENCEPNAYGPICEHPCHCNNAGKCDRVTGNCEEQTPRCVNGWLGRRCNIADPCKSDPCQNQGSCVTAGLTYRCSCTRRYTGDFCQFMNRCYDSPCQNGGQCRPMSLGRYKCDCIGDFFGDDCQLDASKLQETHKYMGCFREYEKKLAIPTQMAGYEADNMTIGRCARKCKSKSFTYAGLKKGQECWCSNAIGLHGALPESECMEKCSGNQAQLCGGMDETSVSVYTVCPVGYYKVDCKGVCKCLYEQCRQDNGKCEQNLCKVGWEGEKCDVERGESGDSMKEAIKQILYILVTFTILTFSGSFANGFKHLQETAAAKKRMETFKEARINQEMEKIKAEMKQKDEEKKKQIKEMKQKRKEMAKKKAKKKKKGDGGDSDGPD